jgi:uncharacterized protein YjbI with pentapeptide repeats
MLTSIKLLFLTYAIAGSFSPMSNIRIKEINLLDDYRNYSHSTVKSFTPSEDFEGIIFYKTQFNSVRFIDRSLSNIDFTKSNISNLKVDNSHFENIRFQYSTLKNSIIKNSTFTDCNFSMADLRGADIKDNNFKNTIFDGAIFDHATKLPFSKKEAEKRGMKFLKRDSQ